MKNILLLIGLFPAIAFAALSDLDKADLSTTNILKNPGFESGFAGWTKTGGTWTLQTSGSKLGFGKQSLCWDSSASGQKLQSTLNAIPNALKGKNGEGNLSIQTLTGTSTHKFRATDGTNTLGGPSGSGEVNVATSVNFQKHILNFPFPSTGSARIEIESVASNEPEVCVDLGYIGEATNLTNVPLIKSFTSSDQTITSGGSLSLAHSLGVVPSSIELYLVNQTTEGNYNPGDVLKVPCGISNTASDSLGCAATADTTNINIRFGSYAAVFGILNKTTGVGFDITPANWKLRVRAIAAIGDQTAVNSFQTDYTDTPYTPTFGSGFGTVTSIVAFHRREGAYLHVHGSYTVGTAAASIASISLPNGLSLDTSKISLNNATGSPGDIWGEFSTSAAGSAKRGSFVSAPATSTTLLYYSSDTSGNFHNIPVDGNVVTDSSVVHSFKFKVPIQGWKDTQRAPTLVGSVTSGASSAIRIEYAAVSSTGTVSDESSDWMNGNCTNASPRVCTIQSGMFSSAPICFATGTDSSSTPDTYPTIQSVSTTSFSVMTNNHLQGFANVTNQRPFNVTCMGPR